MIHRLRLFLLGLTVALTSALPLVSAAEPSATPTQPPPPSETQEQPQEDKTQPAEPLQVPPVVKPWELVERAKQAYEYGDCNETIEYAESALRHELLPNQKKDALLLLGLCRYYKKEYSLAKKAFTELLFTDPDFEPDPLYVWPEVMEFFENLKEELKPKLDPIRKKLAKQKRRQKKSVEVRIVEKKVIKNVRALNFLPFGVGQFQNGHTLKGYIIMGVEIAALALNVGSYIAVKALAGADGKYTPDNAKTARAFQVVQFTSAGLFFATWIYGTVDGLVYFKPETVLKAREVSRIRQSASRSNGFEFGAALRFRF